MYTATALATAAAELPEDRSVPIPPFLADELMPYLAGTGNGGRVFTRSRGTVLCNRVARQASFDRATKTIGEPGLTPHEMGTLLRAWP
jgi:hypothetical protein